MTNITLIIRPQPDSDRDVNILQRYGVSALASPSMTGIHQKYKLPDPASFCGIILTSRNAVDAIKKSGHASAWAKMPAFIVGRASAAAARDAGFLNIVIGTGGGAGLVLLIRQHINNVMCKQNSISGSVTAGANLPFFWPSAVEISFDMVAAMAKHDIIVKRLQVYQMIANDVFDDATRTKLGNGAIAAVVAMSARSIQIFREKLLTAGQESSLEEIALIAGSSAIAVAGGDGWRAVYVARQPRRSRLLAIAVLLCRRGY